MNRYITALAVIALTSTAVAQEGRIRIHTTSETSAGSNPQPGIVLQILKVVNGTVTAYDLNGNSIPGTRIDYVFADTYGRQRGAIGKGLGSDPDHKVSIAYYDGYIEAASVTRFTMATTAKTPDGSITAYRPGSQTPIIALRAEEKPSTGFPVED